MIAPRVSAPAAALPVAVAALLALDALAVALMWPLIADGNDYVGIRAGASAILAGADPYDPLVWASWPHAVGQRPDTAVFGYPPWVAVMFIPFALLPLRVGSLIWTAGGLALATLAALRLCRRFAWPAVPFTVLVLASWPALFVFLHGQWGYLLFALSAALLLAISERRDVWAGAAWGSMLLAKPQLFLVGSAALAVWATLRHRPLLIAAAAGVVAAGVAVGTIAAPGWIATYAASVLAPRSARSTQQPALAGLAGDVAGAWWPLAWLAAVLVLGALIVWAVRRAPADQRAPLAFAATLALSVAAAPYSWSYDHYLALPLAGATLGLALRLPRPRRLGVLAATALLYGPVAFLLWQSAYVRWHDTLSGLVPVGAIVLAVLAAAGGRDE